MVYEKVVYWVASEHYLPVKVENYDEFGDLVSTINFREIKNMGGRMLPTVWELIPQDRSGHRTILTTTAADFSIDLDQGFFTLQNLTRVR